MTTETPLPPGYEANRDAAWSRLLALVLHSPYFHPKPGLSGEDLIREYARLEAERDVLMDAGTAPGVWSNFQLPPKASAVFELAYVGILPALEAEAEAIETAQRMTGGGVSYVLADYYPQDGEVLAIATGENYTGPKIN